MSSVTSSPPADGGTRTGFGSLTLDHTLGSIGHNGRALKSLTRKRPIVKLSSTTAATAMSLATSLAIMTTAVTATALLAACETAPPQPVAERLAPDTATTLPLTKKPVELVGAGAHGPTGNPFAFIAPFETNRMGKRAMYLWMAAPTAAGVQQRPQL